MFSFSEGNCNIYILEICTILRWLPRLWEEEYCFFFFFGWVDGWGWMGFYSELIFNENPPFAISGFRWRFFLADLTASMPKDSDFTFFHDAFEAEHFANCM